VLSKLAYAAGKPLFSSSWGRTTRTTRFPSAAARNATRWTVEPAGFFHCRTTAALHDHFGSDPSRLLSHQSSRISAVFHVQIYQANLLRTLDEVDKSIPESFRDLRSELSTTTSSAASPTAPSSCRLPTALTLVQPSWAASPLGPPTQNGGKVQAKSS